MINVHKMAPRGREYVFVGMSASVKGYLLYDIDDKTIFVSRDVSFYETQFLLANIELPATE